MADYHLPRPPPRIKSWIKAPAINCKINRYTYPIMRSNLGSVIWTHNGCLCNQVIALTHRHQIETPVCQDLDEFEPLIDELVKGVKLEPWTYQQVIDGYIGQWKQKYKSARASLLSNGLQPWHSILTLFVKDDKEHGQPEKAGRAIQYRSPEFCLSQAVYTKAVEEWFYDLVEKDGSIIVGKKDGYAVAKALETKFQNYKRPVALEADASKFDTCVDIKWLKKILQILFRIFPKKHRKQLYKLWSQTFINRGRSRKGLKYKTWGTRASGDMDTGLGNSIIMYLMLRQWLKLANVNGSILVNGDDSVVVIEHEDLNKMRDMTCFNRWGFNMKLGVAHGLHEVEFCQSKVIRSDYGLVMARNPVRVMRRTGWTTTYRRDQKRFLLGLGLCENAASFGVPIAGPLAKLMIQAGGGTPIFSGSYEYETFRKLDSPWKHLPMSISGETRVSYWQAWGITPEEQIKIETSAYVGVIRECTEKQVRSYLNHTLGVC